MTMKRLEPCTIWRFVLPRKWWKLLLTMCFFVGSTFGTAAEIHGQDEYFTNKRTFKVYCDIEEFGVGVKNVELFFRSSDDRTWRVSHSKPDGYSADGVPYFEFTTQRDGRYEFYTVATDLAGNREAEPDGGDKPGFCVIVDTVAPEVAILEPIPGTKYKAGDALGIRWKAYDAHLGTTPVSVEYSEDGGETWLPVAVAIENSGFFEWSLPQKNFPNLLLRVQVCDMAGNTSTATLSRGLQVTADVPTETAPVQVRGRFARRDLEIHYIVKEDVSGIKSILLWYTSDEGRNWQLYGADTDLTSPVNFIAPEDGYYGFWIQSINNADMKSRPDPIPGTKPDVTTIVDSKFPLIVLERPRGADCLEGGKLYTVSWRGHDEFPLEKPVRIYLSSDSGKTWKLVAGPLENTQRYDLLLPQVNGNTFRLKISFEDLGGNISECVTEDFTITTETSTAVLVDVRPGGTRTTRVSLPTPVEKEDKPIPRNIEKARQLYTEAIRFRGQDLKRTRHLLEKALEEFPDFPEALNDLGGILMELGENEAALKHLKKAKELNAGDPVILFNLGLAYLRVLNIQEGIAHLIKAMLSAQPTSPTARASARCLWQYSERFLKAGQKDMALKILRALRGLNDPRNEYRLKAIEKLKVYGEIE